jgi:hypothetical protein
MGQYILRVNGISLIDKDYDKVIDVIKKEAKSYSEMELVVNDPNQVGLRNRAVSQNNLDNNKQEGMKFILNLDFYSLLKIYNHNIIKIINRKLDQ